MLTSTGKAVIAIAVLVLVLAQVLGYVELMVVFAACLAALAVAGLWMLARMDLAAHREVHPARISEGETATGRLTVTNNGRRRSAPVVATERVGGQGLEVVLPSLAAGSSHTETYDLSGIRRGVISLGPLAVGHTDPLRLLRADQHHGSTATLRVLPHIHRLGAMPTGQSRDLEGPTTSSAPQGGVSYHSLREYAPGDDLRLIHWKSSARTGRLMVRQNVVTNQPIVQVVLDTSASVYADDSFEDAVRVAASMAYASSVGHFPVHLHTTGGLVAKADAAGEGRVTLLDRLTEAQTSPQDPGLAALLRMMPTNRGVSLAVVTGQPEPESLRAVALVRPRFGMVVVVQVGQQFERPPPALAGALVFNVSTSTVFAEAWNKKVRAR